MKLARGFLIAILVALVVAVPLLYSAHRHTTLRNFRVVEDGVLYRSGQLSPAAFERVLINAVGQRYGWPKLKASQMRCTMAMA